MITPTFPKEIGFSASVEYVRAAEKVRQIRQLCEPLVDGYSQCDCPCETYLAQKILDMIGKVHP